MAKKMAIVGWIAAFVLAAVMFVQNYLVDHPYPVDAPADSTAVEASL